MGRITRNAAVAVLFMAVCAPTGFALLGTIGAALVAAAPGPCESPGGTAAATPDTSEVLSAGEPSPAVESQQCFGLPRGEPPSGLQRGTKVSPDAAAQYAVAAALTAVGRGGRYVAEGNGPVDFDCSGLTSYAWRQAGVSLVDYSYTQRAQTQDIPRSMVQPGDLVFWFGGSEHHVAIVTAVEGSQISIAEAANPEAGIRTRLLGGSWDEAYLTGFGRVFRA